ncbi:MAG TPA: hypothetical protein VIE65_10985 [Methylobacter sp.]
MKRHLCILGLITLLAGCSAANHMLTGAGPVTQDMTSSSAPDNASSKCKVNEASLVGYYAGGCKDGWANGEGEARGSNQYKGSFVRGNRDGKGTYITAKGIRYEGDFVNDRATGRGVITLGAERYEGEVRDGKRHGEGVLVVPRDYPGIEKWVGKDGVSYAAGKYVMKGYWENGNFLGTARNQNKQNTTSAYADYDSKGYGTRTREVGYDFAQLRDYCAYAKLLVSQVPPAQVEKYLVDSTRPVDVKNEFEGKRDHEKYKAWIRTCIKNAKMPSKTFTTDVRVSYSDYDFSKKSLGLKLVDGTVLLALPSDLIDGWKAQLRAAGINGEPFFGWSSGSDRSRGLFTTVGVFATYGGFNAVSVNASETEAESFLQSSKKRPVPATLTFEFKGHFGRNILMANFLSAKLDSNAKAWTSRW